MEDIKVELKERLEYLNEHNKLLEAQRLEQRTNYDLEMMNEMGYCSGIENYSRHLAGRKAGEAPFTLVNYFPDDFCWWLTNRTLRCRRYAPCTPVTVHARKCL